MDGGMASHLSKELSSGNLICEHTRERGEIQCGLFDVCLKLQKSARLFCRTLQSLQGLCMVWFVFWFTLLSLTAKRVLKNVKLVQQLCFLLNADIDSWNGSLLFIFNVTNASLSWQQVQLYTRITSNGVWLKRTADETFAIDQIWVFFFFNYYFRWLINDGVQWRNSQSTQQLLIDLISLPNLSAMAIITCSFSLFKRKTADDSQSQWAERGRKLFFPIKCKFRCDNDSEDDDISENPFFSCDITFLFRWMG